ncbi:MAG TPA: serpin family protein [Natronosporangium sp.]
MRAHLEFVQALHAELPAAGNCCWSPYSVAAAVGLAAEGARGQTRDELVRALAPGSDFAELSRLLADSASLSDGELAIANSLWLDHQFPVHEEFRQTALALPGGAVHQTDFRHDPEGSRVAINEDVERTTRGLIRELLANGTINQDTAAVIVNALYLKVAWLLRFPAEATAPADFHAPAGPRQVPTMRQQERFEYAEAAGWQLASLPTAGEVVVDVLLPEPGREPALPEPAVLAQLWSTARSTKLDLALPRFRVNGAAVLNEQFERLGVRCAFSKQAADFTGISDARTFIDLIAHQAVLRVDEQGFEGAAATAVVMGVVSFDMSTPLPFHVDRPFLVLVRHRRTGAVYFVARVTEP